MRQINHLDTQSLNALLIAFDGYQRFTNEKNSAAGYFVKIITSLVGDVGQLDQWAIRDQINEELIRRIKYATVKVVNSDAFDKVQGLSPREKEVLKLIAEGHRNPSIQQLLSISYHTVTNHKQHIASKLGLATMLDLQKFAIENLQLL